MKVQNFYLIHTKKQAVRCIIIFFLNDKPNLMNTKPTISGLIVKASTSHTKIQTNRWSRVILQRSVKYSSQRCQQSAI